MHTVKGNLGKRAVQKKETSAFFYTAAPWLRPRGSTLEFSFLSNQSDPTGHGGEGNDGGEEAVAALTDTDAWQS